MIFLFCFGNAVNAKLGQGLFLAAYFLLGALDGVAWLLLGNGMPVVGASGAIMGIVGIFLVLFPRNDVNVLYWFGGAYGGSFSIAAIFLILFYMTCDLIGTLTGGGGGVAYICHLAGAWRGRHRPWPAGRGCAADGCRGKPVAVPRLAEKDGSLQGSRTEAETQGTPLNPGPTNKKRNHG